MLAKDIIKIIEDRAPLGLAYSWDNSGFLCGDINKEVEKVYLTLDVNMYTVDEAVKSGADMILSHHPIMFGGIKRIDFNTPDGYVISKLIKNDIALYAAHTTMDTAKDGLNDMLAEKLGIVSSDVIEKNESYDGCGLGRIGKINTPVTLAEFAVTVKEALKTPFVRVSGGKETVINTAAVGSGACSDIIPLAAKMGADVMVTADMKYHIAIDSVESGICVIDAGHYPTERFVTDIFADLLKNCDLELIYSSESDIFSVY